jgi:UDP:flavonoid glycosyltransferase YjiC (YdhE family)
VEELGVGLSLGTDSRSRAEIRAAVDEVFRDQRYRRAADRLAADTASLPDVEQAVVHLEDLVAGHRSEDG